MIRRFDNEERNINTGAVFCLDTKNTSYVFRVMESGHLEHLYYGNKITITSASDAQALMESHVFLPGNVNAYSKEYNNISLEDMGLEMSSYGKGDIREPFVEVVHADGSITSDFLYDTYEIFDNCSFKESGALPHSYDENSAASKLEILLLDKQYKLALKLIYNVYEDSDVITREAELYNEGDDDVKLLRLMSMQLDFDDEDYLFTTFNGEWAREMHLTDMKACVGKHVSASYTGTSSSRANPFCMLSKENATEDSGSCYGFNLVYSGNHYECVEVSGFYKLRFVSGINPQSFCHVLKKGESFRTPEAVMTYSSYGYNGMSRNMHHFVREHIVRGVWKKKTRPVLLNSWESAYFDIDEKKLISLAKAGKEAGVELFVMDDGWFGERNDDSHSLGDWDVNKKKLPGGLKGLCDKIKKEGLLFGIWVEPEMVNTESRLYKDHPEWVLEIPGKPHSEGRNQRILDLTQKDVQDFIIEKMTEVFSSADISYVKWDMNRTFTDCFSKGLSNEHQGEVFHRYIMGLYRCMDELTKRFPDILFEGCASGGNRFDLGMLCYFPQIWASDNTDALCRAEIQTGYSYGYPMSVISAHVSSCPNHQTLRITPLETRFSVAAFGICGYECNLCDMKKEALDAIKEQISLYKKWRDVLQWGTFYRGRTFSSAGESASVLTKSKGNVMEWTCVSEDKKRAVGMLVQKLVIPNTQSEYYAAKGLKPDVKYHFYNRKLKYDVREFGDLINTASPIHIKQDSVMHDLVAKFVKMDGETEDVTAYGNLLMESGVKLKQAFSGTGYNSEIRHFPDFSARLYFMEEI